MIAYLTPLNFDIKKCEKEISECKWMKVILIFYLFYYYKKIFIVIIIILFYR